MPPDLPPEYHVAEEEAAAAGETTPQFGKPGPRISPQHPLYMGFMGTVGVGLALLVYWIGSNTTQLLLWIVAALFIALGLEPVVGWLENRKIPRPAGILVSVAVLIGAVAGFFATLIPTIVEQVTEIVVQAPTWVRDFMDSDFFRSVDDQFGIRDRITEELDKFVNDPACHGRDFRRRGGLRLHPRQRALRHPDCPGAEPLLPGGPSVHEEVGLPAGAPLTPAAGGRPSPRKSPARWATT